MPPVVSIRTLERNDVPPLVKILEQTGVFTEDEVAVARELMEISLNSPGQKDYQLYSAIVDGAVAGYTCIGPTPLTTGTYDLYWIAVNPGIHHRGIGRELLTHAEQTIARQGGTLVVAETSSQPKYENTRRFYLKCDYLEVARIRDYYKPGDDLVVYGKYLSQSGVK
jgi:ribosomal protein S18 acetylase RimI-like enzyme